MSARPERPGDRMDAVLGMVDLTPTERLLLAKLAFHDGGGPGRTSAPAIAKHIGISRAQYFEHIKSIEKKGRATRHGAGRASRIKIHYAPNRQEIPDGFGAS